MGRKKTKVAETSSETVVDSISLPVQVPVVEEQQQQEPVQLKLTREEILRLELLEHQSKHGAAVYELETLKRELFINQIDPQGRIRLFNNKIQSANTLSTNAKSQYMAFREQIGQRLGIKLDDHSYDPESGNVFKPDQ